jgi:hypothetical protein
MALPQVSGGGSQRGTDALSLSHGHSGVAKIAKDRETNLTAAKRHGTRMSM